MGASTLAQAVISWRTMLWPNVNAIVIADEAERSRSLFEICRVFYEGLDDAIRPIGRYITKRELVFANPAVATRLQDPGLRSRIVVDSAYKKNIAIGANWSCALLSEAARYKDPNFVLDGIIPAVHRVPGTFLIIESSAEMAGTWYRDLCEEAMKGKNAFSYSFVPWILQPEYFICPICLRIGCSDMRHEALAPKKMELQAEERRMMVEFKLRYGHIMWMREKLSEMSNDWDLFRQNFPLTFEDAWVTPGVQVFPSKYLREQRQNNMMAPKRMAEVYPGPRVLDAPQGRLWIWEEPIVGRQYDLACDVAQGGREDEDEEAGDFSAICVLERGTNKQVAEWASKKLSALDLATYLYWLGTYYNTAQVAVETNGIGASTNAQLARMSYSNQYCLAPSHRVLTGDLRWVEIGSLREGDQLIGFDEKLPDRYRRRRYHQADVVGVIPRKAEVYRIVLSDGTEFYATGEHLWLTLKSRKQLGQVWRATRNLKVGVRFPKAFSPWTELRTYDAGWMAGIMDGEGSVGFYSAKTVSKDGTFHQQRHLSINQNPGVVLDKVCELLREWNVPISVGSESSNKVCMRVRVSRKEEFARVVGMVRPRRLLSKVKPEWLGTVRGFSHAYVEAVEKVGMRDVVTFGTTTGTFVTDGFYSHNCWRYRDEVTPRYSRKTGWETNPRSKPWLIGFATHELMNGRIIVRSELLLKEMESYVMKGPREWGAVAGAHDDRCFVAGTNVLTSYGPVPIEQIIVGSSVLSHTGVYNRVTSVGSRLVGMLTEVCVGGLQSAIRTTPEHPFLVRKKRGTCPARFYSEAWVSANDIRHGDLVCVPCPQLSDVGLDSDELYLMGWYLADGYISPEGQLTIVCGIDEESCAKRLYSIIERLVVEHPTVWRAGRGGLRRGGMCVRILSEPNCLKVRICNKWLADRILSFVGPANGKYVHPKFVWSYGTLPFAIGFMEGDGSQKNPRGAVEVSQKDRSVLIGIQRILWNHGIWASMAPSLDRGGSTRLSVGAPWVNKMVVVSHSEKFHSVPRMLEHPVARYEEMRWWVPVKKVMNVRSSETVYNLSVAGDNSYTANGVSVHNCQAWMIALMASDDENFAKYYGLAKDLGSNTSAGINSVKKPEAWEHDGSFGKHISDKEFDPWG